MMNECKSPQAAWCSWQVNLDTAKLSRTNVHLRNRISRQAKVLLDVLFESWCRRFKNRNSKIYKSVLENLTKFANRIRNVSEWGQSCLKRSKLPRNQQDPPFSVEKRENCDFWNVWVGVRHAITIPQNSRREQTFDLNPTSYVSLYLFFSLFGKFVLAWSSKARTVSLVVSDSSASNPHIPAWPAWESVPVFE